MRFLVLIRRTVEEFIDDNCIHMAAAISFYLLLSLFPLSLALVSFLSLVFPSPQFEADVVKGIGNILPVSREFVVNTVQGVVQARGVTSLLATLLLAWGGIGLFAAVRKAINTAWGITTARPFLRERLAELLMMLGAFVLFLVSFISNMSFQIINQLSGRPGWPRFFSGDVFSTWISNLFPFVFTFLVLMFLYKFVPRTRVRWRDIWAGALTGAVGLEGVRLGYTWYVAHVANYSAIYGSVGAVIVLLGWAYCSMVVLLFGAELASVYPRVIALKRQRVAWGPGGREQAGPER